MTESISITVCRKTTSGNLVQFQLSVIRENSFSVSLRLTTSLGEAGLDSEPRLDSEHPSLVERGPAWPSPAQCISLGRGGLGPLCLQQPAWSIYHLSYTVFPGFSVWWRIFKYLNMCGVEKFLV